MSLRTRSRQAHKKAIKVSILSQRLAKTIQRCQEVQKHNTTLNQDLNTRLSESDRILSTFRKVVNFKKEKFKMQDGILEELEKTINTKTAEVSGKIDKLESAILEWQTANFLVSDQCRVSSYVAAERFHQWHQIAPLLQSWLSSEDRVHRTIYATSFCSSLCEELDASEALRETLTTFADAQYQNVATVKVVPQLKNLNEQRQARSEAFDNIHTSLSKQLRHLVRECDEIYSHIVEREAVRAQLSAAMMDLKTSVEDDMLQSLLQGEVESRRSIEQVMEEMKKYSAEDRRAIARTYMYLAHTLNEDVFAGLCQHSAVIFRKHNDAVLRGLELYESESMANLNAPPQASPTTAGLPNAVAQSVVSDLSESVIGDSKATVFPTRRAEPRHHYQEAVHGGHAVHDYSEVVAQFKEYFEVNKQRLVTSSTRKLLKTLVPEVVQGIHRVLPQFQVQWNALMSSNELDEQLVGQSEKRSAAVFKPLEHRSLLEKVQFSQLVLTGMQRQYAGTAFDTISTVSLLLEKLKARSQDTLSESDKSVAHYIDDALHVAASEEGKLLTAQELVDRVADTVEWNRRMFDSWMNEQILFDFQKSKSRLNSQFQSLIDKKRVPQAVMSSATQPIVGTVYASKSSKMNNVLASADDIKSIRSSTQSAFDNIASSLADDDEFNYTLPVSGSSLDPSNGKDDAEELIVTHQRNKFRPFYTYSEDRAELDHHRAVSLPPQLPTELEEPSTTSTVSSHLGRVNSEGVMLEGFGETADQELSKVEVLMKGTLFTLTLFWKAVLKQVYMIVRHATSKTSYQEYKLVLDLADIAIIIDCPLEMVVNRLFSDSAKIGHQISQGLQIEQIESSFYDEIVSRLIVNGTQIDHPVVDIKMYLPYRKDRRASVLQSDANRSSFRSGLSRGSFVGSKTAEVSSSPLAIVSSTTVEVQQARRAAASAAIDRPFDYLLRVLTLRTRVGVLIKSAFAVNFSVDSSSINKLS